jgi:hypothetical protein
MAVGAVTQQPLPVTECFIGRQVLVGGAATVAFKRITQESIVLASCNSALATGALSIVITPGTGFVVTSSVGGDVGFVGYMVIIPVPDA